MSMGVRNIMTPSGRTVRTLFPSRKMTQMIPCESTLERDAILFLEFAPDVVRYEAQPIRISYLLDGELRHYFPDFEVEYANGRIIHLEVKPSKKLAKPEIKHRYDAIARHYERGEIGFQILTERELRAKALLDNLRLLAYHMPRAEDEAELMDSQLQLSMLPASTVGGAAVVLGDIKLVYRLLAANYLYCNLNEPITNDTYVCYRFMGGHHGAVFH